MAGRLFEDLDIVDFRGLSEVGWLVGPLIFSYCTLYVCHLKKAYVPLHYQCFQKSTTLIYASASTSQSSILVTEVPDRLMPDRLMPDRLSAQRATASWLWRVEVKAQARHVRPAVRSRVVDLRRAETLTGADPSSKTLRFSVRCRHRKTRLTLSVFRERPPPGYSVRRSSSTLAPSCSKQGRRPPPY